MYTRTFRDLELCLKSEVKKIMDLFSHLQFPNYLYSLVLLSSALEIFKMSFTLATFSVELNATAKLKKQKIC